MFGDIAQGRIIQQINLAEAYLSANVARVSCGGKGPLRKGLAKGLKI